MGQFLWNKYSFIKNLTSDLNQLPKQIQLNINLIMSKRTPRAVFQTKMFT